jgi:outer membrane protein
MNNYLKILLLSAALMCSTMLHAQALKFGHINSAELIQLLPNTKTADSALRKFGESLDTQLKTMSAEYQNKLQSYNSKRDSLSEIIRGVREKELTDLGARIQDFQQTAQESIQSKKEELYGPILKKAEDAIKEIAKEKGYSYIFDTSSGTVLYAQDSDNIMDLVKSKLGITAMTPTTPPKATKK